MPNASLLEYHSTSNMHWIIIFRLIKTFPRQTHGRTSRKVAKRIRVTALHRFLPAQPFPTSHPFHSLSSPPLALPSVYLRLLATPNGRLIPWTSIDTILLLLLQRRACRFAFPLPPCEPGPNTDSRALWACDGLALPSQAAVSNSWASPRSPMP